MNSIRSKVVEFAINNKDTFSWKEIAEKFELTNDSKTIKKLSDWLRYYKNTGFLEPPVNEQSLESDIVGDIQNSEKQIEDFYIPPGLKIKSAWQNSAGKMLFSFEKDNGETEDLKSLLEESFKEIVSKTIKPIEIKTSETNEKTFLMLSSDKHVGADTPHSSVFENNYNKDVFKTRMDNLLQESIYQKSIYGKFEKYIFVDLGDALDGMNGETTRGGHKLPQNLSDREQFDVYFQVHKEWFDNLIKNDLANHYVFIGLSNSNHDGSFGYTAQRALEIYLNAAYPSIETIVTEKFFYHYKINDLHTYIFTHGKDDTDMSNGLPLILNDKTEKYIDNYIRYYKINTPYISVVKGDLHQSNNQYAKNFRYKNVMSLYGSSKWIHTNFGNTPAGCDYEILDGQRIIQSLIQF